MDNKDKQNIITIEDNGIGREAARAFSADSTGMGLKIMEHFYDFPGILQDPYQSRDH